MPSALVHTLRLPSGLLLEFALIRIATAFTFEEVKA